MEALTDSFCSVKIQRQNDFFCFDRALVIVEHMLWDKTENDSSFISIAVSTNVVFYLL